MCSQDRVETWPLHGLAQTNIHSTRLQWYASHVERECKPLSIGDIYLFAVQSDNAAWFKVWLSTKLSELTCVLCGVHPHGVRGKLPDLESGAGSTDIDTRSRGREVRRNSMADSARIFQLESIFAIILYNLQIRMVSCIGYVCLEGSHK